MCMYRRDPERSASQEKGEVDVDLGNRESLTRDRQDHSFIHLFSDCVLSSSSVLGIVRGTAFQVEGLT